LNNIGEELTDKKDVY